MQWTRSLGGACIDASAYLRKDARTGSVRREKERPTPGTRGRNEGNLQPQGGVPPERTRERSARGLDIRSLLAFGALCDFELDLLSFLERLKAAHLNRGEVRKQILTAVVRGYKAITLGIIEPLYRTCWHRTFLSFNTGTLSTMPVLQRSRGILSLQTA